MRCPAFLLSVLAFGLLQAASPSRAAAETPSKETAARAHYDKGATYYREGDYARAWLEFTSAHQLLPRVQFYFNMARCEVKLGRRKDALEHFRLYLEGVPGDPDAASIRAEMAELRETVAREEQEQEAKRAALARQSAPPPPATAVDRGAELRRPFPIRATIAGAATLVLGIAGAAVLGDVSSRYGKLYHDCAPMCMAADVQQLQQQATAGYVLLGLFGAGVITTAVLLTLDLQRPPQRPSTSGALRLVPAAYAGLGWRN